MKDGFDEAWDMVLNSTRTETTPTRIHMAAHHRGRPMDLETYDNYRGDGGQIKPCSQPPQEDWAAM